MLIKTIILDRRQHKGILYKGPRSSCFWLPRNLSTHMDRQARARDTVLDKSREMTLKGAKHFRSGRGGGEVKTTENKIMYKLVYTEKSLQSTKRR
jgi:hypothetical protein